MLMEQVVSLFTMILLETFFSIKIAWKTLTYILIIARRQF